MCDCTWFCFRLAGLFFGLSVQSMYMEPPRFIFVGGGLPVNSIPAVQTSFPEAQRSELSHQFSVLFYVLQRMKAFQWDA
jgi:hypothetical protein